MKYQIINGNNIDVLKTFPDNHFDSIVTDPPYGIDFLGKAWDANTGALETYQECLRVLKPGGHILAFSAARTYHHLAITLEQAGFEIRDQIMWIYSSGFPKSQDVGRSIQRSLGVKEKISKQEYEKDKHYTSNMSSGKSIHGSKDDGDSGYTEQIVKVTDPEAKAWAGWGTALKPAHEPIALARKPIKLSIAKNAQKWGTGALNIDATRIPTDDPMIGGVGTKNTYENFSAENTDKVYDDITIWQPADGGRFPSNVLGEISEPYQKYFYCPKVSRKERHTGFDTDNIPTNPNGMLDDSYNDATRGQNYNDIALTKSGNNHPTVKPVELMKYLIKLVTPKGGRVLDPFNGSGSTGMAAVELGHEYVGIELDPAYVEIAKKRIEAWNRTDTTFGEIFE
jgi:site-specific DNA-methyltransferase (adenine-specific)